MTVEIIVAAKGQRIDQLVKAACPEQSRAAIQRAIKAGCCLVNGQAALEPAYKPKPGQRISFELPERQNRLKAGQNDLEIIWQDAYLAIVNKPAGLVTHPCPSCQEETLVHKLLAHFPQLAQQEGERPGIAHRLDKDTSGLLAVGLTEPARLALARAFGQRDTCKEYLALVYGKPPLAGESQAPIGRHPTSKTRMAVVPEKAGGRAAHSSWRKLWQGEKIALLAVRIHTGRTHQIRVHLAHAGWPLLGDTVYASGAVAALAPRQMLHAWKLALPHPLTGKRLSFQQVPPADFLETIMANEKFWLPVVITGNQGCGKSAFCEALANQAVPSISADAIVAQLYAHKSAASEWIESHFGPECLAANGAVDKNALFELFQQKPHLRHELEKTVHGLVAAKIAAFWQEQKERGCPFAIAEIPLYFESNLKSFFAARPLVMGISCPQSSRWQRIMANRHWSLEKIKTMERWQWPEAQKMAACDQIIANDGTKAQLEEKAIRFLTQLREKCRKAKTNLGAELGQIFTG